MSTAMKESGSLPPSERDWEVYRLVRVEQRSTRAVAKVAGISQTRVCQVVERTAAFVVAATPVLAKDDEARRIAVARQLAAERIDFLVGAALRCFRQSVCAEKVIRQESGKPARTTIRQNFGEVRYLNTAARLALLAAKLPLPTLSSAAFAASTELDDEPIPAREKAIHEKVVNEKRAREKTSHEKKPPAKGDCSPASSEQAVADALPTTSQSATAAAMLSCVEESRAQQAVAAAAARPVQTDRSSSKATGKTAPLNSRQAAKRREFFQTG